MLNVNDCLMFYWCVDCVVKKEIYVLVVVFGLDDVLVIVYLSYIWVEF